VDVTQLLLRSSRDPVAPFGPPGPRDHYQPLMTNSFLNGWVTVHVDLVPLVNDVYGGLSSGRLVIVGAPGAGKSGAAILLVLDALRHRGQVAEAERDRDRERIAEAAKPHRYPPTRLVEFP